MNNREHIMKILDRYWGDIWESEEYCFDDEKTLILKERIIDEILGTAK